MQNSFVNLKPKRMRLHVEIKRVIKYLSYQTQGDDNITH